MNSERNYSILSATGRMPMFALGAFVALACGPLAARAQSGNASSATNPYWGSVTAQPVTGETLKLSLDDAVKRGLQNNLGLREAQNNQKALHGERNQALQEFLPTVTVSGDMTYAQHDLVALGFSPGEVKIFACVIPGLSAANFSPITRDNLTEGVAHLDWTIFSGPVIAGWRAAGAAVRSSYSQRCRRAARWCSRLPPFICAAIADQSEVENAKAQVAEAQLLFDHSSRRTRGRNGRESRRAACAGGVADATAVADRR